MNDAQQSITVAFAVVLFVVMLRHDWFQRFTKWIKQSAGSASGVT